MLLLTLHALAALTAPLLIHWLARRGFLVLALVPGSTAVWLATQTGAVLAGDGLTTRLDWVPGLGLAFDFRLDTLSWLLALIVSGVGALVLVYCTRYFSATASALGRFAGVFVAFAGAMLGLVTTDNTLLVYIFWELTTVFSFLLIGHYHTRQASRRAALQAITVTTLGGLSMLAGLAILGLSPGGSFRLSELIGNARAGVLDLGATGVQWAVGLVLVGALTKAAQIPFHFWLPAAMAAPTPVSAYLHAAAMVKAGVYLVARLAPGFSSLPVWQVMVVGTGAVTMLLGGYRALRQHDLKLVLAFGTVSQLGFIILLVGHGSSSMALAGLALLTSHALFKSCLFLATGLIDLTSGSRDLRKLSGLGRQLRWLSVVSGVAVAAMAGLPPTLGYVAKEAALAALWHGGSDDWVLLVVVFAGSVMTLGYGLRWWWGAFSDKPGVDYCPIQRHSWLLDLPPTVLGLGSLLLGLFPSKLEQLLQPHAASYVGEPGHLTLWAGLEMPALLTMLIVVAGSGIFWARRPIAALQLRIEIVPSADSAYRAVVRTLNRVATDVTARSQRGSLPYYLGVMLLTMVTGAWVAIGVGRPDLPGRLRAWDNYTQAGMVVVVIAAVVMLTRTAHRMTAVLLLGVVGYGVAVLFAVQGAPDLALTQTVVETVTLVVFVLVLRRFPTEFSVRPQASRRLRALLGVAVGVTVAVLGLLATGARIHEPVTVNYPQEVYEFGYGRNIVNVTLVDTRAWDTIGELSVLLVAATGVASLMFVRGRRHPPNAKVRQTALRTAMVWHDGLEGVHRVVPDVQHLTPAPHLRAPSRGQGWLSSTNTLTPRRRSVIVEIGTRMLFPALLVFSLFLLFSGHNAPGGGFAGGTVAGIAFITRYLAGGRFELHEAAPISPGRLLGIGMGTAVLAALAPVVFGGTILQTTVFDFHWPIFGPVHLATALFFDIGVYLIVVGLVLDLLNSLGGEIDRQGEREGAQNPEIDFDDPDQDVLDDLTPDDLQGASR